MEATQGYRALRENAAWFPLRGRGVIQVAGEDRARLLHAMTTNHIAQLTPGQGCYAFFLTAQGKIIADAHVLCFPEFLLLDVEPEARARVYEHLDKYIIADDVTLEDRSKALEVWAIEGPGAAALLERMGAPVAGAPFAHAPWEQATLARISATGLPGFRLFLPAADAAGWRARVKGVALASVDEVRTVRIECGKPRLGEDIYETTLPMETQQTHALHFQKGCYLGQEIVERVRSRGHINRLLVGFRLDTDIPPEPRAPVLVNGQEVGRVTSAVFSPAEGRVAGMAYVRVPHDKAGTALMIGTAPGVVTAVSSGV
jgi:folate-binding protein YgfZ